MSQESVRVVEEAYETLASSGIEAFADHWAEDVDWRTMREHLHGRQAGRAYMRDWFDLFDEAHIDVVDLIDVPDDQVVTYLRYSGRTKRDGVQVPPEYFAIVIEVRDGKISRAREYATRAEALEAVRLSK
jgi:ketosteroid isomerase-like protein